MHNGTSAALLAATAATIIGIDAAAAAKTPSYLPEPVYSFRTPTAEKSSLGRALMFDKILSGNRNISCGTCHHSLAGTGDGLSLSIGEGGRGLGVTRDVGVGPNRIHERVPRNAPPIWNLGDESFHTLFHDGRVSTLGGEGFPSGCVSPAGDALPDTLESVLACQAMFPVTSATEMAGHGTENEIGEAAAAGDLVLVWQRLADRLRAIPKYVSMFRAAFPGEVDGPADITFAHAANAIAAFEAEAWRADNSPFDQYLRGDEHAMSKNARTGMKLFYKGDGQGRACASCHSGVYQTDHDFHAIAMPQIGAGRGSGPLGTEDYGREQVTGDAADTAAFRTPSLRNVALTAPYGHGGAYDSLRAVVEHHLDPVTSLYAYNARREAILPYHSESLNLTDYAAMDDPAAVSLLAHYNELAPLSYTTTDVGRIIDFLHALTDMDSLDLRADLDVIGGVPSGLPLGD